MQFCSDASCPADSSGPADPVRRRRPLRATGAGLCLLVGAAFVVLPACGGGGGTGENAVRAAGTHATAAVMVAQGHLHPACGGGGGTEDD